MMLLYVFLFQEGAGEVALVVDAVVQGLAVLLRLERVPILQLKILLRPAALEAHRVHVWRLGLTDAGRGCH